MPNASSNTTSSSGASLESALSSVPVQLRSRLTKAYVEFRTRNSHRQYESAGLSAGKFCEIVLRLLQDKLTGSSIPFGHQIPNFPDECAKLAQLPKTQGNESLRVVIPRALSFLYTLRNKRGIGHVGGDVDANAVDSATMGRLADWVMCELIRVFHGLSLEEAQDLVDSLSTRNLPHIWEVGGRKRILASGLDYKEQVLLLLYAATENAIAIEDLYEWTEYSHVGMFRKSVIAPLHKQRFVEYDQEIEMVTISPLGIKEVEVMLLPKLDS